MNNINSIDLKSIKLVIWDLDDTFWKGILAEGEVSCIKNNIEFISELVDKGIMCTICSKNDFTMVEQYFKNNAELSKIWDYFVFKSINYAPKGERIQKIIENMQLRADNVLFIDDNIMNLKEATYYCPKLQTIFPDEIQDIIQQLPAITKDDSQHKRLNQYKILETKCKEKEKVSSNEQFLKDSNICVDIKEDCLNNIDRIVELISRTNQLNYTKIRSSKEEILELLSNENYESKYVSVKDKYGDYGIIGFYSLDKTNNKLLHFLFSCRTLGMGIEQYVYSVLNYPQININGEVVSKLEKDIKITWINKKDTQENHTKSNDKISCKILLKGPCDLQSTLPYLSLDNYTTEFIHPNENEPNTNSQQCSVCIVDSHKLSSDKISLLLEKAPFLNKEDYTQSMFDTDYDIIVYSLLMDDNMGYYLQKDTNVKIPYGSNNLPFTDRTKWNYIINSLINNNGWTEELLNQYADMYEFLGGIPIDTTIDNIKYMLANTNKNTSFILILGSEIPLNNEEPIWYANVLDNHIEQNKRIREEFAQNPRIQLIELTDIVKTPKNYTDCVNHFKREVYYDLAIAIKDCIRKINKNFDVKINMFNKIKLCLRPLYYNIGLGFLENLFSINNIRDEHFNKIGKEIKIFGIKHKIIYKRDYNG